MKKKNTIHSLLREPKQKQIYILIGASGTGKTTLGEYLKSLGVPEMVSHTTREMRVGEIPGVTYHYVSQEEFEQLDKIEYTEYPVGSGRKYCLSREEVDFKLSNHNKVFAITDYVGVEQLKISYPGIVKVIYIHIPIEEMENRMRSRGDSEESINGRLKQAIETDELSNAKLADYTIENRDLEESKKEIKRIISL